MAVSRGDHHPVVAAAPRRRFVRQFDPRRRPWIPPVTTLGGCRRSRRLGRAGACSSRSRSPVVLVARRLHRVRHLSRCKESRTEYARRSRTTNGGITPNSQSSRFRYGLIAILISASGGCRTVRNQLKSLSGSDSSGAATASANNTVNGPRPKSWGFIKGPTPVLDQTYHVRHDPSELNPGRGPGVPRFNWSDHSGRVGGAFSDGSGTRHERGS